MYSSDLITPQHLARKAVIYIRQSTPNQVISHQESLRLQYALGDRARQLGWPVVASTEFQRSLSRGIRFFSATAVEMGTWTMAWFHHPIITSVLPAMAAWTALRDMRSLRVRSQALAGMLRIE